MGCNIVLFNVVVQYFYLFIYFLIQHFGFRPHFVLGPQPARVEGCPVTQKVLEGAVSPGPWTHPLRAQVEPCRQPVSLPKAYLKQCPPQYHHFV